jgi:hypothetical protein
VSLIRPFSALNLRRNTLRTLTSAGSRDLPRRRPRARSRTPRLHLRHRRLSRRPSPLRADPHGSNWSQAPTAPLLAVVLAAAPAAWSTAAAAACKATRIRSWFVAACRLIPLPSFRLRLPLPLPVPVRVRVLDWVPTGRHPESRWCPVRMPVLRAGRVEGAGSGCWAVGQACTLFSFPLHGWVAAPPAFPSV